MVRMALPSLCLFFLPLAAACLATPTLPATTTGRELARCRRWVLRSFRQAQRRAGRRRAAPRPSPGLMVLANHDAVLFNGRPDGRPLKLGELEYRRGLICHAVSKVRVRLPGPSRTFLAVVGVDANAGGGTVQFAVRVGETMSFRSSVLRGGQPGVPLSVQLDGARELTLEAGDAGDGITCDHADWADARVVLQDGRTVWLSDLPLIAPAPRGRPASTPPFSFLYGGQSSDELLGTWRFRRTTRPLDRNRIERTDTYTDPETGLEVRCVAVDYRDFATVEWTLYFRNGGHADTPILEDIQALDTCFACRGPVVLHHNVGSPCQPNDYQPLETPLPPGALKRIAAAGGRPTNSDLSYFNLEWGGQGVIAVVGWPGQWAAHFGREAAHRVRVCAGQELTHFRLHPGEEVRTPLIVLQFWEGDQIRAQNLWRRWMVAHNLPRPSGALLPVHYGSCFGNLQPRAEEEIAVINGFVRERIPLDFWFIDAGWYPSGGNWANVGTWEVDTTRFPNGLREVADHVHAHGMKFVVWFEPERVAAGSWLAEHHPEWVLGGRSGGLLNLGNPKAWRWVVAHLSHLLTTQDIDVYRQDFNIDPLPFWRANDAEDRQGITEIRHVTGYLALWDELLRRHPGLWIDTCASGGRRNDLETLRRSVPLLRSDYWNDPVSQQAQTLGIAQWIPYYGSGMAASDPYWFRSCIFPASRIGWDTRRPDLDYALLRRMVAEFNRVKGFLLGDFYPLTPYSLDQNVWMAWQFDRPEQGEGVLQAFRRAECPDEGARFRMLGLEARERYAVTDLDTGEVKTFPARQLIGEGLPVHIPQRPGAVVMVYRRLNEHQD